MSEVRLSELNRLHPGIQKEEEKEEGHLKINII